MVDRERDGNKIKWINKILAKIFSNSPKLLSHFGRQFLKITASQTTAKIPWGSKWKVVRQAELVLGKLRATDEEY